MADVVLSDGREIELDLYKITLAEYRSLFDKSQDQAVEDELMCRVSGMTVDELHQLAYPDWRKLTTAFFEKSRNPLAEKN